MRRATDVLGFHTGMNIAREREMGKSWEQIAKRFLFASAEEAKSAYSRWQHRNNIKVVD